MNTKSDVIKACTIVGNIVKLPDVQLERKLYVDVAKSMELIGGKWKGGKVLGFVFPNDPTKLLDSLKEYSPEKNLKKDFQYFFNARSSS